LSSSEPGQPPQVLARGEPSAETRAPEGFFGTLEISEPKRILIFFGCAALSFGLAWLAASSTDIEPAAARALFILLFAATLWVTEAIPGFAVSILVIALQIRLLGDTGGVFAETTQDWEHFVAVIGHPLVWLFFGGFVLAAGMSHTGVDRRLAARVLTRLGDRPSMVLLGVMAITFVLSMFVSNTATTAMMLAILVPLLTSLDADDPYATSLVLGVAVAANLGGMGSLIGSPPNAIAVGVLARHEGGAQISFLEWIVLGLPLALVLAGAAWLAISRLYPSRRPRLVFEGFSSAESEHEGPHAPLWQGLVVGATLALTVGLWLTSQWHGVPTAAVSFIPIVAFTSTGIFGAREMRNLSWDVLFLLAGGLALGQMVAETGLSGWLVARLPSEGLGQAGIALVMAYATVVLSNFMSNTAAANILIPIGVTMATSFAGHIALPIALAASAAMCLPIATPPNAMAYATGRCQTRDFIRLGIPLGLVTPALAVLWITLVLRWADAIG
jgi:sodium-dependent dicarboxylate transporter 2/3/5